MLSPFLVVLWEHTKAIPNAKHIHCRTAGGGHESTYLSRYGLAIPGRSPT